MADSKAESLIDKAKSIFKREPKDDKKSEKDEEEQKEESAVYVIASSVLLSGILIAATVFYFGIQILDGINDIKYPYDPEKPTSEGSLFHYAREEDLSLRKFEKCIDGETYKEEVDNDMAAADELGISGTPGFYVGEYISDTKMRGFMIPGAYPYETFKQVIDTVNEKGVDTAFEELKSTIRDPLYQSQYDQLLQYYQSSGDLSAEEAKNKAEEEAASYADEKWQIREVDLGTNPPQKEGEPSIVIVEFTDYNCPYCKRHAEETLPEIEDEYISKGVAAYYIRDLPIEDLDGHENSFLAARAVRCAAEQGKYWEFHDRIFGTN